MDVFLDILMINARFFPATLSLGALFFGLEIIGKSKINLFSPGCVRICLGRSLVQKYKVWGDNIIGAGNMLYQSKSQKPYTQLGAIPHRDTLDYLPQNHWFNCLR